MIKVIPDSVLICGLKRTGSTWAYNVCRLAMSEVYGDVSSGFGVKNKKSKPKVIKVHRIDVTDPDFIRYYPIISTIRDPRDMAASAVRRNMIQEDDVYDFLNEQYENYKKWKPFVDLEIRYEDIYHNKEKQAQKILNLLKLNLDVSRLVAEVEKLEIPMQYDCITQLWPNHKTDGRCLVYDKDLSSKTIEKVEIEFLDWMKETRQHD